MDYKIYTLMAILLGSVALVVTDWNYICPDRCYHYATPLDATTTNAGRGSRY